MSSLAAEDGLQHNTCMFNAQDSTKGPDASTSVSTLAQVRTIVIAMGCMCFLHEEVLCMHHDSYSKKGQMALCWLSHTGCATPAVMTKEVSLLQEGNLSRQS